MHSKKKAIKPLILIVEDDVVYARVFHNKLVSQGFEVLHAEHGEQGLALLREHKPRVVLLDMIMPVMDGFTFLEVLSQDKLLGGTQVIVHSNLAQQSDIDRVLNYSNVVEYTLKVDYSIPDLVQKLQDFVH